MTHKTEEDTESYFTPSEVAAKFRVSVRTLNRWEHRGSLVPVRLPSGHRRYLHTDVEALLGAPEATK